MTKSFKNKMLNILITQKNGHFFAVAKPFVISLCYKIKICDVIPLWTIWKLKGSPSYVSLRCFMAIIRHNSRTDRPGEGQTYLKCVCEMMIRACVLDSLTMKDICFRISRDQSTGLQEIRLTQSRMRLRHTTYSQKLHTHTHINMNNNPVSLTQHNLWEQMSRLPAACTETGSLYWS